MDKLPYNEWRKQYGTMEVSDEVQEELMNLHGIDARKEVESALQKEYDYYITGVWDDSTWESIFNLKQTVYLVYHADSYDRPVSRYVVKVFADKARAEKFVEENNLDLDLVNEWYYLQEMTVER